MKYLSKIFLILFVLFLYYPLLVKANTEYVVLLDSVNVRTGPSTNYSRLELGSVGSTYNLKQKELIKDEKQDGSCDAGWYQVDVNGKTGYVCSSYVRAYIDAEEEHAEPTNACEALLKNEGFPSSYWSGLCNLKISHPNWNFAPTFTGLDWSSAVISESACGKSYIASSDKSNIDTTCKNAYTSVWYPASSKAVAYYMDPRNWFSENTIFQFEYLRYICFSH